MFCWGGIQRADLGLTSRGKEVCEANCLVVVRCYVINSSVCLLLSFLLIAFCCLAFVIYQLGYHSDETKINGCQVTNNYPS